MTGYYIYLQLVCVCFVFVRILTARVTNSTIKKLRKLNEDWLHQQVQTFITCNLKTASLAQAGARPRAGPEYRHVGKKWSVSLDLAIVCQEKA